jgi:hypothetical protein
MPQFPQRDLSNQIISTSYQDVVQRYITGSTDWLLDGLGYTILGIPTSSIGGIVLTQDQTASYALTASFAMNSGNSTSSISSSYSYFAETASYALTSSFELTTEISSSWASESYHSIISDATITASYSLFSELSNTSSTSILSEFSDTSSLSLYSNFSETSSYSISSSWSPAKSHVEFGIISGSDFIGSPKYYIIVYTNPYLDNSYIVSVIGDDMRVWSTNNRSTTGFTINSNSNITPNGMVMWRVEGI